MRYLVLFLITGCSLNFEVQMSSGAGDMHETAETQQTTTAEVESGL